jgi:hypothetical protein
MKRSFRKRLMAGVVALALAVPLSAGTVSAAASGGTPEYDDSVVFTEGENGYVSFIIAGIMASSTGRVFAYTDGRFGGPDGSPSDVVMKVSDDGGETWGALQVMASGSVGGTPTLNVTQPSMIEDRVSGRISFFYTVRGTVLNPSDPTLAQIYVRTSTDGGDTFGAPVLVSDVLADADADMQAAIIAGTAPPQFAGEDPDDYGREFFVVGPGSPIQLSAAYSGAGNRIVVPIFAIGSRSAPLADRGYGDMMLISDDGGVTWEAGGIIPVGAYLSNEVSIVELANSRIYLNARVSLGDNQRRSFSRSASGGDNWLAPALIPETVIPRFDNVHAGLLRASFASTDPNGVSRILFSFPNGNGTRSRLNVAVSYDEHQRFTSGKVVVPGSAMYSNLALAPDETILLAYTHDASGGVRTFTVARFNLEWLTDGADSFVDGPDVIVDDRSSGYSETGTGWAYGTSSSLFWSLGYRYDGSSGADSGKSATFTPTLPTAGTYRVYMRWVGTSSMPDAAPVTVHHGWTSTALTVNQQVNGGQWNLLGTFSLAAGDRVTLSAADAGFTVADAVRFEYVGP